MRSIQIKDVTYAHNIFLQVLGVIGGFASLPLFLKTRFGIHTFFVSSPIDVVVLDRYYTVVKIKQNLKPWRLFFWDSRYNLVLELSAGTVDQLKIKVGDQLKLITD